MYTILSLFQCFFYVSTFVPPTLVENFNFFKGTCVNKHSYNVLTATHNRISQGCLYNQSSMSFHVGLGDWLLTVGYQSTQLHNTYTTGTHALPVNKRIRPRVCVYISGNALLPVV